MTDRAAALTYYAMMSLFPALLLGITLLGLFGQQSIVSDASDYVLKNGADPATAAVIRKTLQHLIDSSGGALGFALVLSVVLALNGAAGAFGAAGRALNAIQGVEDDRGFVKHKLADLGATLVVIVLFAIVLVSLFLGGGIAKSIFGTDRARLDGGVGLVDRALAGGAARGHGRLRAGLRPGPGHGAAQGALGLPRRRGRRRALDRALHRLRHLHQELLQLRRRLRCVRRGDRAAAVALRVGQRLPVRRRAQRRASARGAGGPPRPAAAVRRPRD